jgi:hypothetical protein
MEPDYLGILYVWLLFFAVIGIIVVPAFRMKRIAQSNGKKGWPFFLLGIAVGVSILLFNRLIAFFISRLGIQESLKSYFWIPYLVIGYGLVFLALSVFTHWVAKPQQESAHDIIDSDLFQK